MIVFVNTELKSALIIAERIRKSIEQHVLTHGLTITISGGVVQYKGENAAELIHSADTYLYQAKKNGKNQVLC